MKNVPNFILMLLVSTLLISCGNNASTSTVSDSTVIPAIVPEEKFPVQAADNFSGCYLFVSGKTNMDTAFVNLKIDGESASGEYINSIYEKDKRSGVFKGTIKDSVIAAVWSFMQEGMKDSLPLIFKVDDNMLRQKRFSYNKKTGREYISDTSSFSILFKKTDCDLK